MKKTIFIGIFILITALGVIAPVAAASDNHAADRVIIYMIDNLSLNDINAENTPYLWSLQKKGGVGLLNTVTGGERTVKNACATISAGKIAVGSNSAQLNFQADTMVNNEKVADVFFRSTGFLPNPENIVVTNIEVIHRNNEQRKLGKPGQLGDSLHSLGLSTAVVGNSDRFDLVDRPGALLLMSSKGIVDQGQIEKNTAPSFYWTDYNLLFEQAKAVQDSEVILIEYGDLTRLEAMHALFSTSNYNQQRKQILAQIDKSIKEIDNGLAGNQTYRYVISPSPSRNSLIPNALLTPIIIIKSDSSGTLTSFSTRREGIVLLTSLKNSILSSFTSSVKDPIYVSSHVSPYNYLKELNKRAVFSYANQKLILTVLMSLLVLLIIGLFFTLYKLKSFLYTERLLTLILSLPLVLLFMSLLPIYNKFLFIGAVIILCLITTMVITALSKITKYNPLMIILFMTILTICLDLVLGLDLISRSIMSYQIIRGARYYGLGNEYMGILIGATISFATLYLNKASTPLRFRVVKILFALIVFLIAYPLFGVNVGGTITACIALGYTLIVLYKSELTLLDILGILVGTGIVLYLIALIDIGRPFELQSHLGKNINLIANEGCSSMLDIIKRKLEMHLALINYNYLGWIFLALLAGISLLVYKPSNKLIKIKNGFNKLYQGLQGIIIAAIIAILFNDSGITAAATLFIYFFCILACALSPKKP